MSCRLFHVTGRVQGVFFRASARQEALRLGLNGWARNQPDGSVLTLACGAAASLAEYERWLWRGPPAAQVRQVREEEPPEQAPEGFTTG
jgi:acylphosphatase